MLDGTWKSDDTWGGIGSGMVVMAPFTNMPDDVKKMATEDDGEAIGAGKLQPFNGPVAKQDGTRSVQARRGRCPTTASCSMNWYVKGIDDKLP